MTDVLRRFRLDGRVAIVTGASSGIGPVLAEGLAAAGADVAVAARRAHRLDTVRERIEALGRRCVAVPTDVASESDCAALVATTVRELGDLHVLVNNAGIGYSQPALREDPADFARLLAVNLTGAFQLARSAAQAMVDAGHGGAIVNIASVLGITGSRLPQAAYSASKAGLLGLTRDLAGQWSARHGIRVNAIAPSFFRTELTEPLLATEKGTGLVLARTPLGRIGEPEELLGPLLLLASDAGSYLTGVTLPVDGGWSMH